MKYIMMTLAALMLTACSKVPEAYDNRILNDAKGCAFIVRRNVGDTVFLTFLAEVSKPECDFKP